MQNALIDFTEKLVPISDFSQGKASKIFSDVYENDNEYVVIKNNRPIAVVMSISEYKSNLESLKRTEAILEKLEELKLLKAANEHEDDEEAAGIIDARISVGWYGLSFLQFPYRKTPDALSREAYSSYAKHFYQFSDTFKNTENPDQS